MLQIELTNLSDTPKMVKETLCVAMTAIGEQQLGDRRRRREHIARLQRMANECDRHRPIGPDGKHGDRHTLMCGCECQPIDTLRVVDGVGTVHLIYCNMHQVAIPGGKRCPGNRRGE